MTPYKLIWYGVAVIVVVLLFDMMLGINIVGAMKVIWGRLLG